MKTILKICLIGTVLAASAGPARAQEESEWKVNHLHFELGAFAGVFFPSEDSELFDKTTSQQQAFSPAPEFGLRVGFFR